MTIKIERGEKLTDCFNLSVSKGFEEPVLGGLEPIRVSFPITLTLTVQYAGQSGDNNCTAIMNQV